MSLIPVPDEPLRFLRAGDLGDVWAWDDDSLMTWDDDSLIEVEIDDE